MKGKKIKETYCKCNKKIRKEYETWLTWKLVGEEVKLTRRCRYCNLPIKRER